LTKFISKNNISEIFFNRQDRSLFISMCHMMMVGLSSKNYHAIAW
jgi:hypothetical protein